MKILDYIINPNKYVLSPQPQKWYESPLKSIIESDATEHFLVFPSRMLIYRDDFAKLFKKYYVTEIFELSNCYLGTNKEPYFFLHVVNYPVNSIKMSTYFQKPAHPYRDDEFDPLHGQFRVSDKYLPDYLNYLNSLDLWIETGRQPENIDMCLYRTINPVDYNTNFVYPRYYVFPRYDKIRNLIKGEKLAILSDVADILGSRATMKKIFSDVTVPKDIDPDHFSMPDFVELLNKRAAENSEDSGFHMAQTLPTNPFPSYPYIPEKDSVYEAATKIKLHKGDIIISQDESQFFLVDKESNFDLFAPVGTSVLRAKEGNSPEYLFIYLRSSVACDIRSVLTLSAGEKSKAEIGWLGEFPIVMPEHDDAFYKEQFKKLSTPDERIYERIIEGIQSNTVSSILDSELVKERISNNQRLLRENLKLDIAELNSCFHAGAYKAAALMAGAILEAFLIDWLSEIEEVNYFQCTKRVPNIDEATGKQKTNEDGIKMTKKAELCDYIDLVLRDDVQLRNKADDIRETRNLIHIKLCLNRQETISKEKCQHVIDELKDIINSRQKL